ncbi:hypothetical protein N3K66_006898 [Trichothecium roseum]|uniref:Uncharacterized protein n=1 Tax=Trichothecium roseum TaxID=47278 RepID=A0ACC0UXB0_9HYPO|nr:hypothetical protein N3K66_006898 [Trichothecium roseum]
MATNDDLEAARNRPLAEAINTASRSVHAKLNKLIIARLPLALPPSATDPSLYASGLLHIAPIYMAFESIWQDILNSSSEPGAGDSTPDGCDPSRPMLDNGAILTPGRNEPEAIKVHRPLVCDRVRSMLEHLHLPALMRSQRLRADIQAITGWPEHAVEEQLKLIAQTGRLGQFVAHIKRSIENKPHVLLSYSYILFMALFAGGRFIRASLESAREGFWEQTASPIQPTNRTCQSTDGRTKEHDLFEDGHLAYKSGTIPLRFFHFSTPMDGEDLKREFKNRLADSEGMLTTKERHDIVQEAVCIFDNMILLVNQLDSVFEQPGRPRPNLRHSVHALKLGRLRDSVAIAKERGARMSSRQSSSSDESDCSFGNQLKVDAEAQTFAHPPMFGNPDISTCPGLSGKSMRFDDYELRPKRHEKDAQPDSYDGTGELAAQRPGRMAGRFRGVAHLVVAVAFGVIFFGAWMTGHRGLTHQLAY